jgi:Raf kinase inhibitor-like YbhB/YbcL family protein
MKISLFAIILFLNSLLNFQCEFIIKSDDFTDGSLLQKKFTPLGEDINPSLKWENPPEGTKSFALICEDPDCPTGLFTHWAIKNIPKDKREIGNGEKVGFEIRNSWGVKRYKGPRPPFGTHKYYFRLYALSEESLYARNIKELREEIRKYKLGETYIMGKFTKVRRIDKKRKGWH